MARKRRGRGEGGVYRRADGTWAGIVSLGYGPDGKRRRKFVYGATKQEALEKMRRLQADWALGQFADPGNVTVDAWLANWLDSTVNPSCSPTYYERCEQIVRLHLKPHVGRLLLKQLDLNHVRHLVARLRDAGESAWTAKMARSVLHNACAAAVEFKLLVKNPCTKSRRSNADKISPPVKEMAVLTEAQAGKFLDVAKGYRLYALFALALGTGMRQGELLGLSWDNVDFEKGVVHVRKSLAQLKGKGEAGDKFVLKDPKSKTSRRTIKLPAFALDALHGHRKAMVAEGNAGVAVFCTKTGKYIAKSNLIRWTFAPILKKAGLKVRFHDLRHTHASLLLAKGHSIKAVAKRLGHSDVAMTLRTYAHVLPDDDGKLADAFQGMVVNAKAPAEGPAEAVLG
jgi:integrase